MAAGVAATAASARSGSAAAATSQVGGSTVATTRWVRCRSAAVASALGPRDLEQLLARTNGLPLAIEIVAANVVLVGAAEVLRVLGSGAALRSRTASDRHPTLDAVVGRSWEGLAEALRQALGALAVIAGPFRSEAASAALGSPEVAETLGELVDRSLVAVDWRLERGGEWRLLVPIRAFVRRMRPVPEDEVLGRVAEQIAARWVRERDDDPIPCVRRPVFDVGLSLREVRLPLLAGLAASAFDAGERAWSTTWFREREAGLRFGLGDLEGAARTLSLSFPARSRHPPSGPLLLRAELLVRLGRPDEAAAALDELEGHEVSLLAGPGSRRCAVCWPRSEATRPPPGDTSTTRRAAPTSEAGGSRWTRSGPGTSRPVRRRGPSGWR